MNLNRTMLNYIFQGYILVELIILNIVRMVNSAYVLNMK